MKKIFTSFFFFLVIIGCKTNIEKGSVISFGNLRNMSISQVINDFELIPLETTDESLIGYIDKIEFFDDKIYILDSHYASCIFIFSKEGRFLSKLSRKGRGPGEFIYPMSVAIDQRGAILVLDANLGKLLKYNISDLSFIEEVPLPAVPPLMSFAIDEESDWYYFFKPTNRNTPGDLHHFIISDNMGNIISKDVSKPYSGGFLYGGHSLFHKFGGNIYGFTHYSNKIYEFNKDVITLKYTLKFGEYAFPEEDFFKQFVNHNGRSEFYKEVDGDHSKWIKFMYVSQSNDFLVASYQSIRNYYLGVFDKNTNKSINVRLSDLVDDIGLGFALPHPIMNHGDYFVGRVNGADAKTMIENVDDDSNPVLMLYTLKKPE